MANILIIDDEKQLCTLMVQVIEQMGHTVGYALTLEKGLRLAKTNSVEVVFLDVQLPDGDGLQKIPGKQLFARAIHANSRRCDKNFVVITIYLCKVQNGASKYTFVT